MPTYEFSAFIQAAGETEHDARARVDELVDIAGTTMGLSVGIDDGEPVELDEDEDEAEPCTRCDGAGALAGAHTDRVNPCPSCGGAGTREAQERTSRLYAQDAKP